MYYNGQGGDSPIQTLYPERLFTKNATREADLQAISKGNGFNLLQTAAGAVTEAARGLLAGKGTSKILVLCGPGHNGADGALAASLLTKRGHAVTVARMGEVQTTDDAARAAAAFQGPVLPLEEADPAAADLVIDALFGIGLSRDLGGGILRVIERVNESCRPVLAVDIPSGIDGDTGAIRGGAIRATQTVTFTARKPGHVLLPGRLFCGPVQVAPIGIPADILDAVFEPLFVNAPPLWQAAFPHPTFEGHKYHRGHTLVASGGAASTGAARLAARAALRIGSGLVTVASPPEAVGINAAQLTAIMVRGIEGAEGLEEILSDERLNSLVLGPGLGVNAVTRAMVRIALKAKRRLVLDADGLTVFAGHAQELRDAFARAPAVLTPHEGEFARLFSGLPDIAEDPSKLRRAMKAALYLGAVIVLKGADTVIADPGGRAAITENAIPTLATAGSGDVLAGLIAGLLAQGMDAFEAACAGTWIHAEAGAAFGPGLIAEDLPDLVPGVLRRVSVSSSAAQ